MRLLRGLVSVGLVVALVGCRNGGGPESAPSSTPAPAPTAGAGPVFAPTAPLPTTAAPAVPASRSESSPTPSAQPSVSTPPAVTKPTATDTKGITVYRTTSGTKYHREGCRYLRSSSIPVALEEAVTTLGPCSVCGPPVVGPGSTATTSGSGSSTKAPDPSPEPSRSASVQCSGTTKKGARCKRMTTDPSGRCYQHK